MHQALLYTTQLRFLLADKLLQNSESQNTASLITLRKRLGFTSLGVEKSMQRSRSGRFLIYELISSGGGASRSQTRTTTIIHWGYVNVVALLKAAPFRISCLNATE